MIGKKKIWFKLQMEESPIVFENWFETPPLPIRMHVPLNPPKFKNSKLKDEPTEPIASEEKNDDIPSK